MSEPLGRRDANDKGRKRADSTERKLATQLAGRRQVGSGSTIWAKGDVKLEDFLLDSKETDAGSAKVDGAELVKITREAREESRVPGLVLSLYGIKARGVSQRWALIPLDEFQAMLERIRELEGGGGGTYSKTT